MDITKTILDLHQLFDHKTFKVHLLNSIKELEGSEDFNDLTSILNRNVYQLVRIGDKKHIVKELVYNFNRHVANHLSSNYWTKLYLGIVEKILSFNEPKYKESLISDLYLLLSNLELDAKAVYDHYKYMLELYFAEDGQDIEEKLDMEIYLNRGCTTPFELAYYSTIYHHLLEILSQLNIRFGCYIDEKIMTSVKDQSSTRRWVLGIDLDENVKKEAQEETRLEWIGNISDLAELAAALISVEAVKFSNTDDGENDGKIGAYLFMLFDIQKNMTPDQYYRHINDIKKRNDKIVFVGHLNEALKTYLEEGRKTGLKRRKRARKQTD